MVRMTMSCAIRLDRRSVMATVRKSTKTISTCLWFEDEAEEAVKFYTSIFKNSKIVTISRYGEAGREVHGKPPGSVMTVAFELDGQGFTALNGGPIFKFHEAISPQVTCQTPQAIPPSLDKPPPTPPTTPPHSPLPQHQSAPTTPT